MEGSGASGYTGLLEGTVSPGLTGPSSPLMSREQSGRGFPTLDGESQTVLSYAEDFFAGFEEGYRRCMELRVELEEALQAFGGIRVRRLLRQTNFYGLLHHKLLSPAALASTEAQNAITGKLKTYFEQANATHLLPVADAEEAALLRGDIPYFYSLGNSRDLFASGRVVVPDYFSTSGVENARIRLNRMSEEELRFEKELFASAFSMAVVPQGVRRTHPASVDSTLLSREQFYDEAKNLMERICAHALKTPDGATGWLANLEGRTAAMRPDLMQGTAGLGVFLSACAGSGMDAARPYAESCLESLEGSIYSLERGNPLQLAQMNPGLTDAAGVLRALHLMRSQIFQCREDVLPSSSPLSKAIYDIRKIGCRNRSVDELVDEAVFFGLLDLHGHFLFRIFIHNENNFAFRMKLLHHFADCQTLIQQPGRIAGHFHQQGVRCEPFAGIHNLFRRIHLIRIQFVARSTQGIRNRIAKQAVLHVDYHAPHRITFFLD